MSTDNLETPVFGDSTLDEKTYAELEEIAARYPQKRSGLLPMLHLVQSAQGRITAEGIEACARILEISTADVSGVATFYTMYKRRPVGEYHVGVCTNTLCAVMGGDAIFDRLKSHLDIGNDETTEDGMISLEHIECNAACDYAPVMTVNWEFMDNMTPESAVSMVDELREGKKVRSTRGPAICTWRQAERVLAGFSDGLADMGPTAGPASLVGLEIAREHHWTAPGPDGADASADDGADDRADDRADGGDGETGGEATAVDGAERADTSRAESETKVDDSAAEAKHEDTAEAKDEDAS